MLSANRLTTLAVRASFELCSIVAARGRRRRASRCSAASRGIAFRAETGTLLSNVPRSRTGWRCRILRPYSMWPVSSIVGAILAATIVSSTPAMPVVIATQRAKSRVEADIMHSASRASRVWAGVPSPQVGSHRGSRVGKRGRPSCAVPDGLDFANSVALSRFGNP